MPLAIVMPEIGNIPSVIYHDEAIDSLKQFRTFSEAPELKDIQAAQYWLALMPHPSAWYYDNSVAKTCVNNMKNWVIRQLKKSKRQRTFGAQPISICAFTECRRQWQYRSENACSGGRRWARETWKVITVEPWTRQVHAIAKF